MASPAIGRSPNRATRSARRSDRCRPPADGEPPHGLFRGTRSPRWEGRSSTSGPALLVDEAHEVPLAGVVGDDGGEEAAEQLRFAGLRGQSSDPTEKVDRGAV